MYIVVEPFLEKQIEMQVSPPCSWLSRGYAAMHAARRLVNSLPERSDDVSQPLGIIDC